MNLYDDTIKYWNIIKYKIQSFISAICILNVLLIDIRLSSMIPRTYSFSLSFNSLLWILVMVLFKSWILSSNFNPLSIIIFSSYIISSDILISEDWGSEIIVFSWIIFSLCYPSSSSIEPLIFYFLYSLYFKLYSYPSIIIVTKIFWTAV